jgi:hypothetical protein
MVGSIWLQIQIGNKRRQPQRRERGREGDHAQVSSLLPVGPSHLFWEPVVNIKISQRIKKRERNQRTLFQNMHVKNRADQNNG